MSYKISDAQQRLAERLGETQAPNSTSTDAATRRRWFQEAVEGIFAEKPYYFTQKKYGYVTSDEMYKFSAPTDFRKDILLHINDHRYKKIRITDIDYESPQELIEFVTRGYSTIDYKYFLLGDEFYIFPTATGSPDVVTATIANGVVTSSSHGLSSGDMVYINGTSYEIEKIDDDSFRIDDATMGGNIQYQKCNIILWYYHDSYTYTSDDDPIGIPDKFINLLVSYAEGRYWSAAHLRGKAADAFGEYETIIGKMAAEDMRRGFATGLNGIYI